MGIPSAFKFRKVVSFDQTNLPPQGLVNVYERETDQHIGQLHPAKGGGYLLRNREGVSLSDFDNGRTPGLVALSREPAARMLRMYITRHDVIIRIRVGSVTEGCPNAGHNINKYCAITSCPECPIQPGLKYAIKLLEGLGVQGPVFAAMLSDELYQTPEDAS